MTRWPTILGTVLLLACAPTAAAEPEATVRALIAAFNEQSTDGMLRHMTDDIAWLNLDGTQVVVETEGKEALRAAMDRYFGSCESCRSELERVERFGSRVVTLERAHWTTKAGPKSQASVGVYEFDGERVRRVIYFPPDP